MAKQVLKVKKEILHSGSPKRRLITISLRERGNHAYRVLRERIFYEFRNRSRNTHIIIKIANRWKSGSINLDLGTTIELSPAGLIATTDITRLHSPKKVVRKESCKIRDIREVIINTSL